MAAPAPASSRVRWGLAPQKMISLVIVASPDVDALVLNSSIDPHIMTMGTLPSEFLVGVRPEPDIRENLST